MLVLALAALPAKTNAAETISVGMKYEGKTPSGIKPDQVRSITTLKKRGDHFIATRAIVGGRDIVWISKPLQANREGKEGSLIITDRLTLPRLAASDFLSTRCKRGIEGRPESLAAIGIGRREPGVGKGGFYRAIQIWTISSVGRLKKESTNEVICEELYEGQAE